MQTKLLPKRLFLLFSILCFANVKSECPPKENIHPCRCESPSDPTIVCSNITKMETINDVFKNSNGIRFKYFVLENSAIQFLPASSLISKRIRGLMIINTTLVGLFDQVPSSSNTVEMFTLNNVVLQRAIQWPMFQKLTKVIQMQLMKITIKKLGKEFTDNINQGITSLLLSDNKMTTLADGVFVNLNDLWNLHIIRNNIKTLKRSMFGRPARIRNFDFMHNRIESLPDDIFTDMPDLEAVGLKGNKISILKEPVFVGVFGQLAVLNVEENPIKCECAIRWITTRYHSQVLGTCVEPSSRNGKKIKDLSEEDFKYCN
ncbi:uncharacterized protein TNIN_200691 [Trichonephila inaurata madagascariensis]|uniref:Uncharacterized protein n=1 Tax=Trichonephila inaurata madagascariensis TaxID=2747483 RepID=A0A8X6X7R1_9ARAC|nr:uncharacterized protein TNIN_200691 [Trichonephila inaurata madagascariensis]